MYAHFGKPFVQVADGNGTAFDPNASGSPDMVGRNHQESYGLSLGYHVFTTFSFFFSGALAVHTHKYIHIHIHVDVDVNIDICRYTMMHTCLESQSC